MAVTRFLYLKMVKALKHVLESGDYVIGKMAYDINESEPTNSYILEYLQNVGGVENRLKTMQVVERKV